MTLYANLDFTKQFMASEWQTDVVQTREEQALLRALRTASRRLDREFGSSTPLFAPYRSTRTMLTDPQRINSRAGTLRLDGWLLAFASASVGDTSTDAAPYPDANAAMLNMLKLTNTCCTSWYGSGGTASAISISGVWGFHREGLAAFVGVDVLAASIDADATTITVENIDGEDEYGLTPRISAGDLLSIDDEYVEVLRTAPTANTAVVRRGANGTEATAHNAEAAVNVWRVEEPIRYAVARQAALTYTRRGAYTTVEAAGGAGMVEVRYPADFLREVYAIMQEYAHDV